MRLLPCSVRLFRGGLPVWRARVQVAEGLARQVAIAHPPVAQSNHPDRPDHPGPRAMSGPGEMLEPEVDGSDLVRSRVARAVGEPSA